MTLGWPVHRAEPESQVPSAWGFLTGVLVPVRLPVFACLVIVPLLCLLSSLYLWVLPSLSGLLV